MSAISAGDTWSLRVSPLTAREVYTAPPDSQSCIPSTYFGCGLRGRLLTGLFRHPALVNRTLACRPCLCAPSPPLPRRAAPRRRRRVARRVARRVTRRRSGRSPGSRFWRQDNWAHNLRLLDWDRPSRNAADPPVSASREALSAEIARRRRCLSICARSCAAYCRSCEEFHACWPVSFRHNISFLNAPRIGGSK